MYAFLLALAAATLNAAGDLMQRRAARHQPDELAGSWRLLWRLARRPIWVAGVASLAGLLTHIVALSVGTLAVIQPVLVLELPLAVLAASWLSSSRLAPRDWAAVLLMAAGLAAFVASLSPTEGRPLGVGTATWVLGLGVLLALVVGLALLLGRRLVGERRGLALGAAAGVGYGATAVLFAAVGAQAAREGVAVLGSWQPYAAVAFGGVSFYLLQNGLAAGKLVAAAPGLTLANPLVAVIWGVMLFGEQPRTGVWLAGAGVGAATLTIGTIVLTRSPLLVVVGAGPHPRRRARGLPDRPHSRKRHHAAHLPAIDGGGACTRTSGPAGQSPRRRGRDPEHERCGDGRGVVRLLSCRRWAAERRWFTRAARRDGPACCGSGRGGGVVTVDTQSRRPQTRSPDGCSVIVAVRSHGSFPDSGRSFAQRMRPVVPFYMCVPNHPVAVEGRAQRMSLRLCLASTPLRCCAPSPHRKS